MTETVRVKDIRDGLRSIDVVTLEVVSMTDTRSVETRFGNEVFVADAVVKDSSGEITLTLWNDDIKKINVGDIIDVKNGHSNQYRGTVKLNVGRYGTLTVIDSPETNSAVDAIAEDEGR
jgi:replication factor A1